MESLDASSAAHDGEDVFAEAADGSCARSTKNAGSLRPVYPGACVEELVPPINRLTLKELDIDSIRENVQIRHDLVLDPRLRITRLGTRDTERTAEYWATIQREIAALSSETAEASKDEPRGLAILLWEIKALIKSIFPHSRLVKQDLEELDVALCLSQLRKGLFDPIDLAELFAKVIQSNSAPKRDPIVAQMIALSQEGRYMQALRMCTELLELAKMDMANYELRKMREQASRECIYIEQSYFKERLELGVFGLANTRKWLRQSRNELLSTGSGTENEPHAIFLSGLIRLLKFPSGPPELAPETFHLDQRRLVSIHDELVDTAIIACICLAFRHSLGSAYGAPLVELKASLRQLLQRPDTNVEQIADVLADQLKDIRPCINNVHYQQLHDSMRKLADRVVTPDSGLFRLVEENAIKVVKEHLGGHAVDRAALKRQGLLDVKAELLGISARIHALAALHWRVYSPLYARLCASLPPTDEPSATA